MTIHDAKIICPCATLMNKGHLCNNIFCQHGNYFFCLFNNCYEKNIEFTVRNIFRSCIGKTNLKYVNKFITPSNALRNAIINAKTDITDEKLVTISNYVSEKEFENIEPNYNNKGYFLYVGRLSKEKGVHYLMQAIKELPNNIEFHIIDSLVSDDNPHHTKHHFSQECFFLS